jgi:hypothetical protein
MTFKVDPAALRTYARQLSDVQRVADAADHYVKQYGSFSFHEQGLIGWFAPGHHNLMGDLKQMMTHLGQLGEESKTALEQTAGHYEHADLNAEARIDATYPEVPRLHSDRD